MIRPTSIGHASVTAAYAKVSLMEYPIRISLRKQYRTLSFICSRKRIPSKFQQDYRPLQLSSNVEVPNNEDRDILKYQIDNGIIYRFRGIVETGYGRGGKKLGFPTANLGPSTFFDNALMNISTGVYFGYTIIEQSSFPDNTTDRTGTSNDITYDIHKSVVNIGYSPTFEGNENKMKIIEAHLLLPESQQQQQQQIDFYNATIRLQLIGYLRPEMKFSSFSDLIQQITNDIDTAKQLFMKDPCTNMELSRDAFFVINQQQPWIGKSGGNLTASFEIVPAPITNLQQQTTTNTTTNR
jgi:riboflavin kinase